jgi:inactive STAND
VDCPHFDESKHPSVFATQPKTPSLKLLSVYEQPQQFEKHQKYLTLSEDKREQLSESYCLLTPDGCTCFRNLLETVKRQANRSLDKTHGEIVWLSGIVGLDREPTKKIVAIIRSTNNGNEDAVHRGSLETFYECLQQKISNTKDDFPLKRNYWFKDPTRSQTKSSNKNITVNELADLFWNLDYSSQEDEFKKLIRDANAQAIAFSLSAPDPLLHRWLLRRLSILVNDNKWLETATVIVIEPLQQSNVQSSVLDWGLDDICQQIKHVLLDKRCKLDTSSNQKIINSLVKYSTKHPVLIKVSNLQQRHKQILVEEFWPLLASQLNVNNLSVNGRKFRLIMFLLENQGITAEIQSNCNTEFHELPPLAKITFADIVNWAVVAEKELEKCCGKGNIDNVLKNQVAKWRCLNEQNILEIFQQLLNLFHTDHRFQEIAEYWKI